MSDEVWMSVNWKYEMSWIVQNMYSFETKNCSYLDVHDNDWPNLQNIETYNL